MTRHAPLPRRVAIVLGCGDVGSAVALALHQAGLAVVLADEADPSWHRRGMALTNAWYVGNAELESEGACFCASLKSIPSILSRRMIAATTWSWPGVATALEPEILIDARGRKRRSGEVLRGRVPHTVGIGPGFAAGEDVDLAIGISEECPAGCDRELPGYPRLAESFHSKHDVRGSSCVVEARRHGRFMTERRIGDAVRIGQIVGGLGNEIVAAPSGGVLLGLAARGARVEPGDLLAEVDPEGLAHRCYGVRPGLRRLAARVVSELAERTGRPLEWPPRDEVAEVALNVPKRPDGTDAEAAVERHR